LDYLFGALILLVGRHNGFAAQIWTDIKSALGALVFAADQGLGQVIDKTFLLRACPEIQPFRLSSPQPGFSLREMMKMMASDDLKLSSSHLHYCSTPPVLRQARALSRQPIRLSSLKGLLKNPNAPAFIARVRVRSLGKAVTKIMGT
jgi:hypothetical protein